MDFVERKPMRLKNHDYSANGYYFITICTAQKQKILCDISVGANFVRPNITFSEVGKIVHNNILALNDIYDTVQVDKYVIMPNHVHLIIVIKDYRTQFANTSGRTQFAPTVSRIIKQFKGTITKQVGYPIWQKSFYDHIIRDENDYLRVAEYMENNPEKWSEDQYFKETKESLS